VKLFVLVPLLPFAERMLGEANQLADGNAGALGSGPTTTPNRVSVPFLVDDHFIPSGCMGDCASNVVIDGDCPGSRYE